jgi:exosome complex component RRP4
MSRKRELVLPGDHLGSSNATTAGSGTAAVGKSVVALTPGLVNRFKDTVSVMPINGAYEPSSGDTVVGIVRDANPGNWIIDIKAPWDAPMHVSEAPWRVDFGETMEYLRPGDAILCKVLFVDAQKKVQVTLKDRNLTKLEGGELMEVPPVKVARVIGKSGSMLNMIKEYVECWLFVGQNGRIWINGEPEEVLFAKNVINMIANEAHLPGLTERVRAYMEANKPQKADAELHFEEEE